MKAARFNGNPCRACGSVVRYVSCKECVACAATKRATSRERSIEYGRAYRARNGTPKRARTDELRAQENARYQRKAAVKREAKQAELAARATEIAAANAIKEEKKAERKRQYMRRWRSENPLIQAAQSRTKKARKRNAPGRHTAEDVQMIGLRQRWRCAWCRVPCAENYHVDHIVPLAKGGSNWPDNLCISCPTCNMRKKDKLPHEFAKARGMLL